MAGEYYFNLEVETDDDVEELFEIIQAHGPYVTSNGYELIAFSNPEFVTEGYRDIQKCLTIPQWQLYEVYIKDLEAERAVAETVDTLLRLHITEDEILDYFEKYPNYFDVSPVLMNDQLTKIRGRKSWFDLPDFD